MRSNDRSPAMDVIRCFALLCVVGIHYFLHNDYYYLPVTGRRMYVMTLLRSFFMVCVPLFLMLSGYLMRNKKPCAEYYKKIIRILVIYVLVTGLCTLYRWLSNKEPVTVQSVLSRLLGYTGSNYGWYIEMYIGLFFLIPYINILLDGLKTRRQMLGLVVTLLALSSLPSVINIYNWTDPQWWQNPAASAAYHQLIPQWWTKLYPLTYYVLGSYLRKYPVKMKAAPHFLLLCAVVVLTGTFAYYRSYGSVFVNGRWQDNESLLIAAQSFLLFSFLQQRSYRWLSAPLRSAAAKLSEWTLGAYLVSWILDDAVYTRLALLEPDPMARVVYMPLTVCGVYVLSLLISGMLNGVCNAAAGALAALRSAPAGRK